MKITVVGPGAMGTLFAVLLSNSGHEVHVLDKNPERASKLREKGLLLEGESGEISATPDVTNDAVEIGESELVAVCVKAYDTESAAASMEPLVGKDTVVLTLQNGLGNVEILATQLGADRVLAGSTSQGANVLEPGRVHHAGTGDTCIGEPEGPATERVKRVCLVFSSAGIPATESDDVQALLWGKLIINVGINPLTGLLQVRNGQLLDIPETLDLMKLSVAEAVAVATAKGVKLPFPDPLAKVMEVARLTGKNRSSMYQDIASGKRTEINAICGAVVREGETLSIPTPVNRVLTLLVRARCFSC